MAFFVPTPTPAPEGGQAVEAPEPDATLTHPVEVDGFDHPRLWQVHRSWILAEVRDGLLLIDQHAAHERILFERIMARFDEGEAREPAPPLSAHPAPHAPRRCGWWRT
jgi:DNA mismatch repair ATPase MutL